MAPLAPPGYAYATMSHDGIAFSTCLHKVNKPQMIRRLFSSEMTLAMKRAFVTKLIQNSSINFMNSPYAGAYIYLILSFQIPLASCTHCNHACLRSAANRTFLLPNFERGLTSILRMSALNF